MNKLGENSTIDKTELIELPKDSVLPTGFRFINLSILSDLFSLWRVQIARQQILSSFSALNTTKNDLQDLCKLNVEAVNLSIALTLHHRLTAPKTMVAEK